MNRAMQRPDGERFITMDDLRAGAVAQRRNRLQAHTDKVVPKVTLSDMVLPEQTRRQVEAFVAAARKRSTVYSAWGFGDKMSLGKALSALFTGESGVGKTLTACCKGFGARHVDACPPVALPPKQGRAPTWPQPLAGSV